MNDQETTKAAQELRRRGFEDVDLDEIVHNLKSVEAAEINNGGIETQVRYIFGCGMALDQLIDQLIPKP